MKNIKNNQGVTLVALTLTVIILLIITNIIIYNVRSNLGVEKLKSMQNDIEELNDKIAIYYTQYGKIPAKYKYSNIDQIKNSGVISETADTGEFYVIDLSAIENLTLTYGKDYENVSSDDENSLTDLYIINEDSHNIFYAKGITVNNKTYYTNYTEEDVDTKSVELKYVEGVKIPEGYVYVSGTKESGIQIKEVATGNEYEWIVVNDNITKVPSDLVIDSSEEEQFIKSVNTYGGYYKLKDGTTIKYIPFQEEWSEKYDVQAQYKDKNGDVALIPKGFKVSKTKGQDSIEKGLVIQDDQENSYVWIAVPKSIYTDAKYTTDNDGNKVTSDTDYIGIYNILSDYASEFRDTAYKDKWYALDGSNYITEDAENLTSAQKKLTNGCGLSYTEYIDLRNNMLKSIYNNGGFWISQYEIGTNTSKADDPNKIIVSQKDMYTYNNVTCAEAQELSQKMKPEDGTSSLLFGIQWDLTCKFISENSNKTKSQLTENSKTIGNYQDSEFEVKKGKYSVDNGANYMDVSGFYAKDSSSNVLFTTGISEKNSALNIYDLAGNIEEMTLEQSNDENKKVTIRGGSYLDTNKNIMSYDSILNSNSFSDIGFRVALY